MIEKAVRKNRMESASDNVKLIDLRMVVRQKDSIYIRKFMEVHGRVRLPGTCNTRAEVDMVACV